MAILAATAIIALEDSGIIGRSKNTVSKQNYNEEYTMLQVIKNGILTDNLGTITVDEYITELTNKGLIESGVTTNADGSKSVTTKAGFEVILSQNGTSDLNITIDGYTPPSSNTGTSSGNSGNNTGNSGNSGNTQEYTLSGKWTFNDTLTQTGWASGTEVKHESINFYRIVDGESSSGESTSFDYYPVGTMEVAFGTNENANCSAILFNASRLYMLYHFGTCESGTNPCITPGAVNSTYKTIDFGSTPQTVSEEFYNWFTANAIDMDDLISFTIDGVSYLAEPGMTWGAWVQSSYNTGGFLLEVGSNDVVSSGYVYIYHTDLAPEGYLLDKQIVANEDYYVGTVITFNISDKTFSATNGMTWEHWVNSSYNANGDYEISEDMYVTYLGDARVSHYGINILITEKIISNTTYTDGTENCCFDPGTQILMADGTLKNIEDVKVGDMVMSLNEETGEYIPQRVEKTIIKHNSDDLVYVNLSNGIRIGMRAYHPLLTTEGWKSLRPNLIETKLDVGDVELLKVGDTLVGYDENVKIVSIETREGIPNYDTYNLAIEGHHNYIANGVVVHNFAMCAEPM